MRSERILRLGRVKIDDEGIVFEPEGSLSFEASLRDDVSIGIAYEYIEQSDEKEEARIRLVAHIDGAKAGHAETTIVDNPVVDDSRRGFLAVPVKLAGSGEMRGTYKIEASYASGPWRASKPDTFEERVHEGTFMLRVR